MKGYSIGSLCARATGLIWLAAAALSSGCASATTQVTPTPAAGPESALVAVATPTQSPASLNLTPTAASIFAAPATETAVLATSLTLGATSCRPTAPTGQGMSNCRIAPFLCGFAIKMRPRRGMREPQARRYTFREKSTGTRSAFSAARPAARTPRRRPRFRPNATRRSATSSIASSFNRPIERG